MEVEESHPSGESSVSQQVVKKVMGPFIGYCVAGDNPPIGDPSNFTLVRPIKSVLNVLSQPHGSVKLWQGDTCVLAAVFGPSDVRMSKELPHRSVVDVIFRPKVTGTSQLSQVSPMDPMLEERTLESVLTSIFENTIYLDDEPGLGCGFNIIVHELENDGCLLASCTNAVSLALLDGGCSLRSSVAAVTILLTKDNKLIIDPSSEQQKESYQALMTFVFSTDDTVLFSNVQGLVSERVLKFALREGRKAAEEVFTFYQSLLSQKAQSFVGTFE